MMKLRLKFLTVISLGVLLGGCAMQRADDAATAKKQMVGMTRLQVLACMGIPNRKAHDGALEVWSYLSTDGRGDYNGDTVKVTGYTHTNGEHNRSFCTVNIVMNNGAVSAINYNGPTSSYFFSEDDQCGYAVKNCVPHNMD